MTEYPGVEVPRGGTKVVEFFTEKSGVPSEPYEVEVEWRDPAGVARETDKLSLGTVYRPTGSTADSDPGHFKAAYPVASDAELSSAWAAYGRWKSQAADAFSGWALIESFTVVESELTITTGAPYLCTTTDVTDLVNGVNQLALPAGANATRILKFVEWNHGLVLNELEVATAGELSPNQQVAARGACAFLAAADLLFSIDPTSKDLAKVCESYRERAWRNIARIKAASTAVVPLVEVL